VPVAVSCSVEPATRLLLAGETAMLESVGPPAASTVTATDWLAPDQVAVTVTAPAV